MSRSINYSASPLLASRTPVWRSKFIVAALAVAFAGLAGRAAYVQVFGNDFFQRQGEVRFTRTIELPANRGRILDRNGLILATSVVAQSSRTVLAGSCCARCLRREPASRVDKTWCCVSVPNTVTRQRGEPATAGAQGSNLYTCA